MSDAQETLLNNQSGVNTGDQAVAYATTIGLTDLDDYSYNDLTNKPTVGDGSFTEKNFTSTLKTKLDGIATGANNYSHPTGDGNLHVPATGTSSVGKILTSGSTAGSAY
jgi:hypothetical protein